MPEIHEYLVAWTIYVVAGVGCCVVWWKITSRLGSKLLRDLLRGIAVVAVFTPWYATPAGQHYAPAIVVLLVDVFLQGARGGLKGGVALLFMLFVMLLILTLRRIFWRPRH